MAQAQQSPPCVHGGLSTEVSRGDRVGHAVVAGLIALVFIAGFLGLPAGRQAGVDRWRALAIAAIGPEGSRLCLLRRTTGLPCPTCGMTRSFCAMGRGDLGDAFRNHPLGPVLYALLAFVMGRSAVAAVRGRRLFARPARLLLWTVPALLAAAVVVWVVRLWGMLAGGAAAEAWRESLLGRIIG